MLASTAICLLYNFGILGTYLTSLSLLLNGTQTDALTDERPTVNVPLGLRQRNWLGSEGEGSCVHASLISVMRWQGKYELADLWRRSYGDGEYMSRLAKKLDANNVIYAYVTNGDVNFLEWACSTRRGCGVTVQGGAHMVTLVHLDNEWAAILDNNDVDKFKWIPRATFIAEWKASYGWAVTVLYSPAAPLPKRLEK